MNTQVSTSGLADTYFFDLPLSDIYGSGCSALNLIYYGSRRGIFGPQTKEMVDLHHVDAFEITLSPRSMPLLSHEYAYHLVYFRKHLSVDIWDPLHRKNHPILKELTRRVELNAEQSTEPHRLRNFYIKSHRPLYVAKYDVMPNDNSVPLEYINDFDRLFEGYLIRSPKDYELQSHLFCLQNLHLTEQRNGLSLSSTSPRVLVYSHNNEGEKH
jgi:hypothetical protein